MIARLLQLFAQPAARPDRHTLDLACAALLTEIMRADHQLNAQEQASLQQTLRRLFHLNEQETAELMQEALQHSHGASDLFQFTDVINRHWQAEEKFRLLQGLWQVAYSDAHLDHYEEHMIRRISDLLHIPHSEFIRAKLSVKNPDQQP